MNLLARPASTVPGTPRFSADRPVESRTTIAPHSKGGGMFAWLNRLDAHFPIRYTAWLLCGLGFVVCAVG